VEHFGFENEGNIHVGDGASTLTVEGRAVPHRGISAPDYQHINVSTVYWHSGTFLFPHFIPHSASSRGPLRPQEVCCYLLIFLSSIPRFLSRRLELTGAIAFTRTQLSRQTRWSLRDRIVVGSQEVLNEEPEYTVVCRASHRPTGEGNF